MAGNVSNLLNQQIAGRYRRSQISLNPPKPGTPLAQALASAQDAPDQNSPNATPSSSAPDSPAQTPPATADSTPAAASKRKTRDALDGSTSSKRTKASSSSSRNNKKYDPPATRLSDFGGASACIEEILELVAMPICHPEVYLHTGVRPPRGVLLHGPPGCGKTMLAGAIAGELGCPFINVSAPSIVSGMSGESEKQLRDTFEEAAKAAPCILFIDEIDAITGKREQAQREMERRIVAQLLTCLDDLAWDKTDNKPVMVIGATNRPDSLDPALRRAGRFDHEIAMGVPDQAAREQILRVLAEKLRLSGDFDYTELAARTPGYVGADLSALTGVAGIIAVKRIFDQLAVTAGLSELQPISSSSSNSVEAAEQSNSNGDSMMVDDNTASVEVTPTITTPPTATAAGPTAAPVINPESRPGLFATLPPELQALSIAAFLRRHPSALSESELEPLSINNEDFNQALLQVQPSSKREGFSTVPDVTWDDVGALTGIRDELRMAVVQPIKRPDIFMSFGIASPCGVLLWGPPGCGKTLLAKAVANESRANFISIKGPELLNKYVGESERAVRQVFARARASAPCIIFFDELDALVPRRDDNLSESSARVVNTLLTELDGLEARKQVYVVGATNRPDMIDPAMVRPGRFDKMLYVDLPTASERADILKAASSKTPLAPEVDLAAIAAEPSCEGFSGADLSALVREAAVAALRQTFEALGDLDQAEQPHTQERVVAVSVQHLKIALQKVSPSVSPAQRRRYEALRGRFSGQPFGKKAAEEQPQASN